MELGVLFSGGKDSSLALHKAHDAAHTIKCLILMKSKNPDSWMFHTPNINFVEEQADSMCIPLVQYETEGKKEEELSDLKQLIKKAKDEHNIKGIVSGAIHSTYQASRIQRVCHELGLFCFNPLWLIDQGSILKELLEKNYKVIITKIAAAGLDKSWLGRIIDENFIKDICKLKQKYKINVAGEGGEFESFVLDSPFFNYSIEIKDADIIGDNNSCIYNIKKIQRVEKMLVEK